MSILKFLTSVSFTIAFIEEQVRGDSDDDHLNTLVELHQTLISQGHIGNVVSLLQSGPNGNDIVQDSRFSILHAICGYDVARQPDAHTSPAQWQTLAREFEGITQGNPLTRFLAQNYLFLCLRNAGESSRLLTVHERAAAIAEELTPAQFAEHMGYLEYNYARYLLKNPDTVPGAKVHYLAAARHRLEWLRIVSEEDSHEVQLAAAQQVVKIRLDWEGFFPQDSVDECPVTEEVVAELVTEYGEDVRKFSVNK